MNNVTLSHVDKSYTTYSTDIVLTGQERQSRTRQVLRDLSVTLPEGQITVIVGRSGCGKSTLLKLLAGKEQPDAGTISIPEDWHSAMLSPDPYVITWTSVQRNVAMACGVGKTPEERYEHAAEFVRMVGLEDYADLTPVELSTGMKQRLGLARVLAGQAQLLLMDEPFADPRRVADAAPDHPAAPAPHHRSGDAPAGGSPDAGTEDRGHAPGQHDLRVRPHRPALSPRPGQPASAAAEGADHCPMPHGHSKLKKTPPALGEGGRGLSIFSARSGGCRLAGRRPAQRP